MSTWNKNFCVTVNDLERASTLVKAGLLSSVSGMKLRNITFTENLRPQILQMRLPYFSSMVIMETLKGDVLHNLLPQIHCDTLAIVDTTLSAQDLCDLGICLNTNVKKLELRDVINEHKFSGLESLCRRYNGDGMCSFVRCEGIRMRKYMIEVLNWGNRMKWKGNVHNADTHNELFSVTIKRY